MTPCKWVHFILCTIVSTLQSSPHAENQKGQRYKSLAIPVLFWILRILPTTKCGMTSRTVADSLINCLKNHLRFGMLGYVQNHIFGVFCLIFNLKCDVKSHKRLNSCADLHLWVYFVWSLMWRHGSVPLVLFLGRRMWRQLRRKTVPHVPVLCRFCDLEICVTRCV